MIVNIPKLIALVRSGPIAASTSKVLGADEVLDRLAGRLRLDLVGHELARRIVDGGVGGIATGRYRTLLAPGRQHDGHEVVVVDAGEPEVSVVLRLLQQILGREPLRLVVLVDQPFGFLRIAAGFRDVADRRAPHDRRRERAVAALDVGVHRHDVRVGIEVEFLHRLTPARRGYSNRRSIGERIGPDGSPATV
jgi:hypothetical protein